MAFEQPPGRPEIAVDFGLMSQAHVRGILRAAGFKFLGLGSAAAGSDSTSLKLAASKHAGQSAAVERGLKRVPQRAQVRPRSAVGSLAGAASVGETPFMGFIGYL